MILRVLGQVDVRDRHSLYNATHKYVLYFDTDNFKENSAIPKQVFCEPCQKMCEETWTNEGLIFHCTGVFNHRPQTHPDITRTCSFKMYYLFNKQE